MTIRVLLADDKEQIRAGLRALIAGEGGVEVVGGPPRGPRRWR